MKDLIERDHALAAVALGDTVNQLQAKIRAIPRAPAPDPAAIREAALREAAALMEVAAENCRKQFTYPPKTKEQRDYQTGAIIHSNAAAAILDLIQKGPTK